MSDAFRETNTETYRNIVTFQSGFGVIADEPFTVGSPTTTQSLLVTYNPIKPFGGISGYPPLTGQAGLEYIRLPFGVSGQGWFLDLKNGKWISNNVSLVDVGGTSLSTAIGAESMDWTQMQLMVDSNGTLDWGTQITYDGVNFSPSLDWTKRLLYDSGNVMSLHWARRQLSGAWVAQSLNISGQSVTTGGPYYPLSNPSGFITSAQTGAANTGALTGVFYPLNSNPVGYIPSGSGFLVDISGRPSVDWLNRRLFGTGITGNGTGTSVSGVKLDWSGSVLKIPISPKAPNGLMWSYEDPANSSNNFYVTSTAIHPDSTRWGFAPCNASGVTDFSWGFEFTSDHFTILQGYQNNGSFVVDGAGAVNVYGTSINFNTNIGVIGYVQADSLFDSSNSVQAIVFNDAHILNDHNGFQTCDFDGGALIANNGGTNVMNWMTSHLIGTWSVDNLTMSGKVVTTGGPYYPLSSNPSGYALSTQTGNFVTTAQTGQFYPMGQNPSGYLTATLPSSSVTTVINWTSGNTFYSTLTGNTTFTFTGQKDGQTIVLSVKNTGTNNFTGNWPSGTKWPFQTTPTQTSGSFTDIYTFVNITGTIYGNVVQGY